MHIEENENEVKNEHSNERGVVWILLLQCQHYIRQYSRIQIYSSRYITTSTGHVLNTSHKSIPVENPRNREEANNAEKQRDVKGTLKQHDEQWQKQKE